MKEDLFHKNDLIDFLKKDLERAQDEENKDNSLK